LGNWLTILTLVIGFSITYARQSERIEHNRQSVEELERRVNQAQERLHDLELKLERLETRLEAVIEEEEKRERR
jgi:septal ring factor EnvC (AmiA/AmiB activator)